jgi:enoyl-CoA hydratase/carnithine racemase
MPEAAGSILVDVADAVATVTLNRPDRLNAVTPEMRVALMETMVELDADPGVGCVVLTGRGRGFCAGADRSHLATLTGDGLRDRFDTEPIRTDYPMRMATPLIAAVNGAVAGIGLSYALMADIRYAAEGATWLAPFASLGLVAEHGTAWLLPRLVGTGAALEILLSAEPFTSETAYRIGLVQRLLPAERVLPAAREMAAVIATRSPHSLRSIKEQVRLDGARSWEEAFGDMRARVVEAIAGHDFKEAMTARDEGRPPRFRPAPPPGPQGKEQQ